MIETNYPCAHCEFGTYMNVEEHWWCSKHNMYDCEMEGNRGLCEKFKREFIKNLPSATSVYKPEPEQKPCEDCVSRQKVLNTLNKDSVLDEDRTVETYKELLVACFNDLPPVKPAPKKGKHAHWIDNHNGTVSCSYCHAWFHKDDRYFYMRYCPNCGAKMDGEL